MRETTARRIWRAACGHREVLRRLMLQAATDAPGGGLAWTLRSPCAAPLSAHRRVATLYNTRARAHICRCYVLGPFGALSLC